MSAIEPTIYVSPDGFTCCIDYGNQQVFRYKGVHFIDTFTKDKNGDISKSTMYSSGGNSTSQPFSIINTSSWTVVSQAPF